ncbi:hypothetical protein NP233_g9266 [Leucocoprinus birnbaumii]|uniref:GST N-terminal domain-containing protein n=1 Tax=Leucocoprinus birnbaumii TaxID=56174 RepID=A0AAD5YT06_9AGAR|nr:hypothetical protein NP233_g9266 [Leucocoprinus birnbaumii]
MITLLEIPGRSELPYSPNTWKVRLALNIRDIPYRTRCVEVVDIEGTCKSLGIPPSGTKPTGEPHYTCPSIVDDTVPAETVKLSDSRPIVEYLDRKYPAKDGTTFFPDDSIQFQNQVQDIFLQNILAQSPFLWLQNLYNVKTPRDQENIKARMEARFGKPMNEIVAKGDEWIRRWAVFQEGWSTIDRLAPRSQSNDGPFLQGNRILYADIVLAAFLIVLKASVSDEEWRQISSWDEGRWGKLLKAFQPWIRAEGYQCWTDWYVSRCRALSGSLLICIFSP